MVMGLSFAGTLVPLNYNHFTPFLLTPLSVRAMMNMDKSYNLICF